MTSGIYNIINTTNGKRYVGLTKNLQVRWKTHVNKLREGKHRNAHLQYAWNTYGESAFIFEVLEQCEESLLFEREHHWATLYDTHNHEKGYNIRPTDADGRIIQSEETKAKIAQASRKPCPPDRRIKISETNKKTHLLYIQNGINRGGKPRKTKEQQRERARLTQIEWLKNNPDFRLRKNLERRKSPADKISQKEHNRKVSEARLLSDKINRIPVVCYNTDRSEEIKFKSLKEAAKFANCSSSTVARHIKNNTLLTNKYWEYESKNQRLA